MLKMKKNKNGEGERIYIVGLTISVMTALFFMMLFAWLLTIKDFSQTTITVLSYVILCISTFSGSWIASRLAKSQGMKIGGIIGVIIFLLIFFAGIIVNGFTGNIVLLIKLIICVFSGMLGGIVGVNGADKRKMKV